MGIGNKLFVIVSLVLGLSAYLTTFISYDSLLSFIQKEQAFLFIGIMSAREHTHARHVIRSTWAKALIHNEDKNAKVQIKFIVGDLPCDIHPQNRKNMYSCEKQTFTLPENPDIFPLYLQSRDKHANSLTNCIVPYWNASITVVHPVVIKRLGLHVAVELKSEPTVVVLYDDIREEKIAQVQFDIEDDGVVIFPYRFRNIKPVLLPTGFEGSIRILGASNLNSSIVNGPVPIENSHGTITIQFLNELNFPVYYDQRQTSIFMASCFLSIFDKKTFKSAVDKQHELDADVKKNNSILSALLIQEGKTYGDILFVNMVDVYRNLPLKVLKFHQWIHSNTNTDFILKTDDDCFIDIHEILRHLEKYKDRKKLWWSSFRYNWLVERFGKWAEMSYQSEVYPAFACGSGNIISSDLSSWLAQNADYLRIYQGEDTSMGIWLSAVGPDYIHDINWKCDKSCDSTALVIPELSYEDIESFWNNKVTCGNPCGCK